MGGGGVSVIQICHLKGVGNVALERDVGDGEGGFGASERDDDA